MPQSGPASRQPPSATFVGRVAELQAAVVALTAARGSLLLISGEVGIGKTTLIDAAVRRIDRRTAAVRAPDDDGTSPYWLWKRLARKLPGVRQVLATATDSAEVFRSEDSAAARFRLHDQVGDALAAAAGTDGLVLVLDDAHLADPASLGLLAHLAGTLDDEPLVVAVTFREPGPATDAWRQVLPKLLRSPCLTRIALAGLTPAECAEYVTAATGLIPDADSLDALMARTDRNPLYLRTMVDALGGTDDGRDETLGAGEVGLARVAAIGAGSDLTSLVGALVVGLPASTRSLLAVASVLEHDISVERLANASGMTPAEVAASCEPARSAGVLVDDRDGLRFSHAVLRDGIYTGMSASDRARWHRVVARHLGSQLPPSEIAAHWGRGAQDPASFRTAALWARQAAQEATAAAAPEMATARYAAVLDWLTRAGADDGEQAGATVELARAQFIAGEVGQSLRTCERAADLAERGRRPDLLVAAALIVRGIGSPDINSGLDRLVLRAMALDTGAEPGVGARLSAQAARVAMEYGRVAEARRLADTAMTLAVASGDDDATLDAVWAQHRCANPNRELPTVIRLGGEALELARRLRRPIDELFARLILLDASLVRGDLAGYDSGLIALTDLARSQDLVLGWWHVYRSRATRAAMQGQFANARTDSDIAHRYAERLGDFSAQAMTGGFSLALAWLRWDPRDIDERFMQQAAGLSFIPIIDVCRALGQVIQGHADDARGVFERHIAAVNGYEADFSSGALYLYLGELAYAFADAAAAAVVYELFLPMAEQCGGTHSVFTIGAVALPLARLAFTCGSFEQSLAHLDVADKLNTRLGARPLLALGKLTRAVVLAGRGQSGDRMQARASVRAAAKEFRTLDMPGWLRQAEVLADELDAAARISDPLSPREREVAELLADGMSNRGIADRLVLSERTVEQHVRSILAKLELTSRTQVALWAVRRQ